MIIGIKQGSLLAALILSIAICLVFTSCYRALPERPNDSIATEGTNSDETAQEDDGNIATEAWSYPDDPTSELKTFLRNDLSDRELPFEVSDVQTISRSGNEYKEFMIYSKDAHKSFCAVSFTVKSLYFDDSFDGHDNPSFVLAFKDPSKLQDTVSILTSVLVYLLPGSDMEEIGQLANGLMRIEAIGGCSAPLDAWGYQIQTHYKSGETYFAAGDFVAEFVITVTALEQIWDGAVNEAVCDELSDENMFQILNKPEMLWDNESNSSKTMYADFIVKDLLIHQEEIHGDITTFVTVESARGDAYTLRLDSVQTPYVFGIGGKYTIFVSYFNRSAMIVYAIQHRG